MEEDHILIKRYLDGDDNSLKMLIEKYTSSVYNFTSRFVKDAQRDDITQEVFIKVWKKLGSFDFEKSQFKTWLFTIARNTITDHLRKRKIIFFSSLDKDEENFGDTIEDETILPDEALQKLQDKELLNKVLNELKEDHRAVLMLHYQEDMNFREIGDVLGKPMNTVKSYHQRALIILRKQLE
ncbi:sigma-70 family RNA polymerase sigma factor [Candidatus Nomurabacteria bacterium]|nr:sigma-70 family RNA polymerase sigma factor [Candidatus Nomurabacteria bacterium]